MRVAEPMGIEEFIAENRLDDNAARALRMEPPDIQLAVVERGSLTDCFNASAAVMGRIRDAKTKSMAGTLFPAVKALPLLSSFPHRDLVEAFIEENRIDDNAARALRGETQEVQAEVLDRGSLADCINASAAVMGRIRDAKNRKEAAPWPTREVTRRAPITSIGSSFGHFGSLAPTLPAVAAAGPRIGPATPQEVEQFILENRLDESAARALTSVPPDVQAAVMDRGSLAVTMNPSSAVMGRIRDAKQAASSRSGLGLGLGVGLGTGLGAGLLNPLNYGALGVAISESLRASPY